MKWRNLFSTLIFVSLFSTLSYAQSYRISYRMNYKPDSLGDEVKSREMILLIKDHESKFYANDQYLNDSLVMKKEKAGEEVRKKYDYQFMVFKDNRRKEIRRFTVLLRDVYSISEKSPALGWKITAATARIGDYNCQKAMLTYSNRTWEAWFTTDIALQNGPYVFDGLPGLIVYMKDTGNNYEFSLTSIKKDENFDIHYLSAQPLEVTAKQLDKVQKDYYNDPYREMKAGNVKVRWRDENGREFTPDYKQLTKTQQEYIKKHNNPIELAEAIRYP